MTDLLVEISPDTNVKKSSILPIQIITENDGQQSINVNVVPERRQSPPMAQIRTDSPKGIADPHIDVPSPYMDTPAPSPYVLRGESRKRSGDGGNVLPKRSSPSGFKSPPSEFRSPSPRSKTSEKASPSSSYKGSDESPRKKSSTSGRLSSAERLSPSERFSPSERLSLFEKPSSRKGSPTYKKPREIFKPIDSKRKVAEVTAAAASKKKVEPAMNSVKTFLAKHPEFAEEFSYTIPVSPTSMDASPFSSPAPSGSEMKKKKKKFEARRVISESEDDDVEEEEEEEIKPKIHKKKKTPVKEESDDDDDEDEDDEEEEEPLPPKRNPKKVAKDEEEDDDDEEEEPADEPPDDDAEEAKSTDKEWSGIEDTIDHEKDVFGSQPEGGDPTSASPKDDKNGKKKKKPDEKPQTEEEEALEKMELIEDIKEGARIGFMPSQVPTFNMPINVLRQIKNFQDEKASEAIHVGYMGTGLVQIVNILETINGRFDPFEKVFGHGLMMQGSKDTIENNLNLYKVPFTKIYRRLRKGGMGGELPPWAQIILITTGIIAQVHKVNILQKMDETARKEEHDPEALRKAREMFYREQQAQQARARDSVPYHVEMENHSAPLTDAQMEAVLEKEFSGFDKLPTLDSLRTNGPVPVAVPYSTAAPATTTAPTAVPAQPADNKQKQTKEGNATDDTINMVHQVPKAEAEDINLKHSADPDEDGGAEDAEDDDAEDEDDFDAETEDTAPIIQVPILSAKKKGKN